MSLLFLEGLMVRCPQCHDIRQIPMKGGPSWVQVGDANVMHQMNLQRIVRPGWPYQFHLDAWCGSCAAPLLASEAQELADAASDLLDRIQVWLEELQKACKERLLTDTRAGLAPEKNAGWLKVTFPQLFEECFGTGLCGLYPDHFMKMKKRFRTQAGRLILRDGLPIPCEFMTWLTSLVQVHPFSAEVGDLANQTVALHLRFPGPWQLVEIIDPWQGINLNPYLCAQQTVFFAAGDPGGPLYFIVEKDASSLTSACENALIYPFEQTTAFIEDLDLKEILRQMVEAEVNLLTWPII